MPGGVLRCNIIQSVCIDVQKNMVETPNCIAAVEINRRLMLPLRPLGNLKKC